MGKQFVVVSANNEAAIREMVFTNTARGLPAPEWGTKNGTISVCGNGPSLKEVFPKEGPIAALNGSWRTLVKHGVMPDFIIAHDPAPQNVSWFVDAPDEPTYLLSSRVMPAVFNMLAGKKIQIWDMFDQPEADAGAKIMVGGGFTIGCQSLNLLNHMGYTHFDLYGYDSSYSLDGQHHSTKQPWNITPPEAYQVGERMFIAEPWMAAQVQQFLEQIQANKYNYTVDVKGDGMLAAALDHNTLQVLYDLNLAPGSFDFMCSMLNVENYRKEQGFSRVHIHLKPGNDRGFRPNEIIDVKHDQKNQMLNHVVRPLIEMFGFEETARFSNDAKVYGGIEKLNGNWMMFQYSPRPAVDLYKQTGELPTYQASAEATRWAKENFEDKPYVITLREAEYWPQRNSNVDEWVKFAKTLDRRVVFLRDTIKANEPLEGFETCPEASLDLHKRLALYRNSTMNFFVTNGPAGLAWYSKDIPYVNFYTSAKGYHCYDPEWLKEYVGLEPYGQMPWAGPHQRLVYADDTFENITKAHQGTKE